MNYHCKNMIKDCLKNAENKKRTNKKKEKQPIINKINVLKK